MKKQSAFGHKGPANRYRQLSWAIAAALFASAQLHAQTSSTTPQASEPSAASEKKKGSSTTQPGGQDTQASDAAAPKELGGITVSGYAASFSRAQAAKRFADTVIDAISAQDAGALPDQSVTEALQRVPGITVSRFATPTDPDHFSVQGSGVTLQGLSYISTLFNGRQVFSAGTGSGLNFSTVSPELISAVEIVKNQTADQVKGDIAGSINLITRKPFDSNKDSVYFSTGITYGENEKKQGPNFTGMFDKKFETSIGRFGIVAGMSFDDVPTYSSGKEIRDYQTRWGGNSVRNFTEGTSYADNYPGLTANQTVYAPDGGGFRNSDLDTRRVGSVLALQWENPEKTLQATFNWVRASSYTSRLEHTFLANGGSCGTDNFATTNCDIPSSNSPYAFDSQGRLLYGTITQPKPSNLLSFGPYNVGGVPTQAGTFASYDRSTVNDVSLNVKWEATDRLHLTFDAQNVFARDKSASDYAIAQTKANWALDLRDKDSPVIAALAPDGSSTAQYFANPANWYWASSGEARGRDNGTQRAFRADGIFDLPGSDSGFFKALKFGVRYADRAETVRGIYTYGGWPGPYADPSHAQVISLADLPKYLQSIPLSLKSFDGATGYVLPYANFDPIQQFATLVSLNNDIWQLFKQRGGSYGQYWQFLTDRTDLVPGTLFPRGNVYSNEEKTKAGYLRLDFGNEGTGFLEGLQITGNAGVRYVRTYEYSSGNFNYPLLTLGKDPDGNPYTPAGYCASQTSTPLPNTFCYPGFDQQSYLKFANGAYTNVTNSNVFTNWLPSFNISIGWTDDLITRFAWSRSLWRPPLSQTSSNSGISGLYGGSQLLVNVATTTPTNPPTPSNPFLEPIKAHNYDVTTEWYFAEGSSLTGTIFYKQLTDTIQNGGNLPPIYYPVTNNGVTYTARFTPGLFNLSQRGIIKGAEVAYTQLYKFLPGWLSGLGTQINYTYIKSQGFNYGPTFFCPNQYDQKNDCNSQYSLPLQGLARNTANVALFYDNQTWSARLAYNWNSRVLVTNEDQTLPFAPVYSGPAGYLDGSIIYSFSEHMKFAFQVSNLLNTQTKTYYVINPEGLQVPKSWLRSERRYNAAFRFTF